MDMELLEIFETENGMAAGDGALAHTLGVADFDMMIPFPLPL
jgi:hypothetical protein